MAQDRIVGNGVPLHGQHDVVVMLVDDQPLIGEAVRRMLAPHDDITFHYCQRSTDAVRQAAEIRPTVILQDLVMPDIDGLDLVPAYRQHAATRDTPLIVLSTREEAGTKAEAFARGANDYLVKLPDPVELLARIRYHSRGYIALLERNEAFQALAASERTLREQLAKAADYVRSLLPARTERPLKTDWRFIPSASLGGDAFDYQWLDADHFAMCLLDVCGHGVGSALLSVSVINSLRAKTLPETNFHDPASVLTAVNRAFPMEQQNSMFFTMWYGVFDRGSRTLRYTGGGHPPAILRPAGAARIEDLQQLESPGPLVGMDEDSEFPVDSCHIGVDDHLYIYSDGAFELTRPDGSDWTFEEFVAFMARPVPADRSRIEQMVEFARQLQQRDDFQDDFSALEIQFPDGV